MNETTRIITGHLTIPQIVTAVDPRPIASPIASATGPLTTSETSNRAQQDHHQQRHPDLLRAQLPERAALVDLVDRVRGAGEGAEVARRRPDRADQADAEHGRGAAARGQVLDRLAEGVDGGRGPEVVDDVEQRVGRLGLLAEEAEQGDEHEQAGEDREDRVVGERRRPVGDVVGPELADGALQRRPPGAAAEVGGRVGAGRAVLVAEGRGLRRLRGRGRGGRGRGAHRGAAVSRCARSPARRRSPARTPSPRSAG